MEPNGGGRAKRIRDVGKLAWPTIDLPATTIHQQLEMAGESTDESDELDPERAADFYLACAAASGDNAGVSAFVEEFRPLLSSMARRLESVGITIDDAVTALVHQFTISSGTRQAKLAQYRGTGSLRGWVRAVAARALIDMHRAAVRKADVVISVDEAILENVADDTDPEIAYLKRHYRDQFRSAFTTAIGELSSEARTFLRHLFVDRLTVRQLAVAYGFHHATAARRITTARNELLERTRSHLRANLDITDGKLDSIMRMINSRFDVSVARLLADD